MVLSRIGRLKSPVKQRRYGVHILLVPFLIAAAALPQTPTEVDAYLASLHGLDYSSRVVKVAEASVETPYVGDPLGEGPDGAIDKDPLMDLGHVDCVTFVEQTLALAASDSYSKAFDTLQRIRYKDGTISFETRNHFMVADWIANNRFCRDVCKDVGVTTDTVTRTMGRTHFFETKKLPELAKSAHNETLTLTYIPSREAERAAASLPSPALILLTGKVDWLFTLHCGLFVRDKDGRGLLYNASSTRKQVVADDFLTVLQSDRYIGFTAYALDSPSK